ncbi:hypothetical protein PC129_g14482 [Phytophthora cactorum]|uniref:Uncharacterized protein n=1 Tax=Phytophthora cactorum TaxID=29920 RepID=A0A8T1BGX5_9STRA|nr:hypothetical protein Pcac1_g4937 [Phytophthora cactorum]KAG2810246.1 hypothetical protein PC112_g16136 [Phytophthora cactorum]KAG2811723.1 hypothetical protein PC111_g15119 [Phytophthora cactorum]KAG2851093.1 hypothetical protein PC113_g16211 [Phytophthora cactorum]KAG2889885.1 hypothetical protein PC114_g17741 [Phytophthora cactorum]
MPSEAWAFSPATLIPVGAFSGKTLIATACSSSSPVCPLRDAPVDRRRRFLLDARRRVDVSTVAGLGASIAGVSDTTPRSPSPLARFQYVLSFRSPA